MSIQQYKRKKMKGSDVAFKILNTTFFGVFSLLCIFPFYYILINSISDNGSVMAGAVDFYPIRIHFENYKSVFKMDGLAQAAMTSVLRTVLGTLFMLIGASVLGYCMTKEEYWHKKFWYRFVIITMYFSAGLIPGYLNIRRLGLLNSFWVYVVGAFCSPYNMILVKTYMENIPSSLEEAAIMDGAGYAQRFFRIVLPLSKPILATVAIFTAVGQWNAYMDTILYMTGNDHQTLQSILYLYLNKATLLANMMKQSGMMGVTGDMIEQATQANPASARYTITAITVLPIIMVYPFFQRFFTKGMMIGAVKG